MDDCRLNTLQRPLIGDWKMVDILPTPTLFISFSDSMGAYHRTDLRAIRQGKDDSIINSNSLLEVAGG